ncbi:MAG: hypothetical protein ABSG63_00975 [Spirochaetia bacterium]|jgi:hypothetical protein
MKVTQPDSRTIRVQDDTGVVFHVPYRIFWNGFDRQAESIVLSGGDTKSAGSEVRAFFLFGEVRDRITQDAAGISLQRTWSVKTPGSGYLSIDVEFDTPADLRCLFPGVHAARGVPAAPVSFLGEKTSYPAALLLSLGKKGVLVFSRTAENEGVRAGIGISRTDIEDESPRLRVELRFPGVEEPSARVGPGPDHTEEPMEVVVESTGSLERSHEIFFSFSPRENIPLQGAAAAFSRLLPALAKKALPEPSIDIPSLREALQGLLATHLWQKGGVTGVTEVAGGPLISSTAGLGAAIAARRLFPSDDRLGEIALQLADFSLKGQLPTGFFFESYHRASGAWQGVRGEPSRTLLSVSQSSRIAELLLDLAADLAAQKLPHEKYFLAALRFVDFFFDAKAHLLVPGSLHAPRDRTPSAASDAALGGLDLFFPLARVHTLTGRDRYKKGMDALVKRFSAVSWDAFQPPVSREGRGPDCRAALTAARLFVEMRALGYKPAEPPVSTAAAAKARAEESTRLFASLLVPWIRMQGDAGGASASGCLTESFVRQRLLYAGYETSLMLLRLGELTPEKPVSSLLKNLARLCRDSARLAPIGTSFFQHTHWDEKGKPAEGRGKRGPVDARRSANELLAGLGIAKEFPKL